MAEISHLLPTEIYDYLLKDFDYARVTADNYETYTNKEFYIKFEYSVQYEYAPNETKMMEIISIDKSGVDRKVLVDNGITLENVKKILRTGKLKSVLSDI